MASYIELQNYQVQLILTIVEIIVVLTLQSCVLAILAHKNLYDCKVVLEAGGLSRFLRSIGLGRKRGWVVVGALILFQVGGLIDTLLWATASKTVQASYDTTFTGLGTTLKADGTRNTQFFSSLTDWDPNAKLASLVLGDGAREPFRVDNGSIIIPPFNITTKFGYNWIMFEKSNYYVAIKLPGNLTKTSTTDDVQFFTDFPCNPSVDHCLQIDMRKPEAFYRGYGDIFDLGNSQASGQLLPDITTQQLDTATYQFGTTIHEDGTGYMVETIKRAFTFANFCPGNLTTASQCLSKASTMDLATSTAFLSRVSNATYFIQGMRIKSSGNAPALFCSISVTSTDSGAISGECVSYSVTLSPIRHSIPISSLPTVPQVDCTPTAVVSFLGYNGTTLRPTCVGRKGAGLFIEWPVMTYFGMELRESLFTGGVEHYDRPIINPDAMTIRGMGSNIELLFHPSSQSTPFTLSAKGTHLLPRTRLSLLPLLLTVIPAIILLILSTLYLHLRPTARHYRLTLSQTLAEGTVRTEEESKQLRGREVFSLIREEGEGRPVVCITDEAIPIVMGGRVGIEVRRGVGEGSGESKEVLIGEKGHTV
ncbi:hypothetical protein HDV00_010771 [Rhizophlyctis rosea]|nr:hypothetical protein HDV00_010771 [Rhizophlyctis rosea]